MSSEKINKISLKHLIIILIFLVLGLGGSVVYDNFNSETIKIANWNLQVFGQAKAGNLNLMNFYADKIDDYDIVFVQEIRDASGTAFPKLCALLENYTCVASSRAGRTSSKEQYGVIYKNGIELVELEDFNLDELDRWERPPIKIDFLVGNYSLRIYNIHAKPDDVQRELDYLESVVANQGNVIVLGDLNADCSYYDNEKETEFDFWNWVISDDADTTSSATDCAYDRIILNHDAYEEFKNSGMKKQGITKEVSDHYLVWVEVKSE